MKRGSELWWLLVQWRSIHRMGLSRSGYKSVIEGGVTLG